MEKLIGQEEAANFLGVLPKTMSVWRSTKRYNIPFYKIGRLVKYKMSDLEKWVEERTVYNEKKEL